MRVLLGMLDRHAALGADAWTGDGAPRLDRAVRDLLPSPVTADVLLDHTTADGSARLVVWGHRDDVPHDDPTHRSPVATDPELDLAVALSGAWSAPPRTLLDAADTADGEGVFALVAVSPGRLVARTSAAGVEPLFVATTRRFAVVGNRAAVVAAAAHDGRTPYDLTAVPELLSAGFALSDATPFAGVRCLGGGAHLQVGRRRFGRGFAVRATTAAGRAALPDDERPRAGSGGDVAADGAALAAALSTAVEPVRAAAATAPVLLSLTGGKDSRLVAAALHTAGIPFATQTNGFPGDADVVVAARIAALLRVGHTNHQPQLQTTVDGDVLDVDPLRRAVDAIRLGEGMISSYENLGESDRPYAARPELGGQGGELLRGGYGHYASDLSGEGAVRFLTRGFLRNTGLLTADAGDHMKRLLQPWLDRAATQPLTTLDDFYRRFRVARWSAAARSAYAVSRNLVQPFFDSRVVALSRDAAPAARVDERLIFTALDQLSPTLARMPFADQRWRFEADGPVPDGPDDWEARTPVRSTAGDEVRERPFNWRVDYGLELRQVFADVVLDPARDGDLFTMVDRRPIEELLTGEQVREQHLSWHLFTLAVLFSDVWRAGGPPPSAPVRIVVR